MHLITAPDSFANIPTAFPAIFLAGSIEQGAAERWQDTVIKAFSKEQVNVFNPRRETWDSSWVQSIDNPQFNEQVNWELDALQRADIILMYFDPATKSPITLLELGLHIWNPYMVVCCPDGFWRRGNIEIVCERYQLKFVTDLNKLIAKGKGLVKDWNDGDNR